MGGGLPENPFVLLQPLTSLQKPAQLSVCNSLASQRYSHLNKVSLSSSACTGRTMLTVSEGRVGERWNTLRMRRCAVTKKSTGTAPDAAFLSTKRNQGEAKETKGMVTKGYQVPCTMTQCTGKTKVADPSRYRGPNVSSDCQT